MHCFIDSHYQNPIDLVLVEDELVIVSEVTDLNPLDLYSCDWYLSIDINVTADIHWVFISYQLNITFIMLISFFKDRASFKMLET